MGRRVAERAERARRASPECQASARHTPSQLQEALGNRSEGDRGYRGRVVRVPSEGEAQSAERALPSAEGLSEGAEYIGSE